MFFSGCNNIISKNFVAVGTTVPLEVVFFATSITFFSLGWIPQTGFLLLFFIFIGIKFVTICSIKLHRITIHLFCKLYVFNIVKLIAES